MDRWLTTGLLELGARIGNFNVLLFSKIGPKGIVRDVSVDHNDTDGLLDGHYAAPSRFSVVATQPLPRDWAKNARARVDVIMCQLDRSTYSR